MPFSIATVYWGGQKNLDDFIDHCTKYTDDIVVVYIDLFGYNVKSDKARIFYLDYKFLLDNGYAKTFNLARNYANNDWVYLLGVGKEIVSVSKDILDRLDTAKEAAFSVKLAGGGHTRWFKLSNVEKTNMVGVIHEEPVPMVVDGVTYPMSEEIFAKWKYIDTDYDSAYEKNICDGYRALSRLKWYSMYETSGVKVKPGSLVSSMQALEGRWRSLESFSIVDLYKKYEYLYSLDRKSLLEELSKISIWREYYL